MQTDFDDSNWQKASIYTNETIGVANKPSYINFTTLLDYPGNDAKLNWTANVILDNEVLVRYTVK
ncbi:hypothetical protein [Maribacter litoralis]|uniref:hypothetical protein n=1 Tax=Maribacter litoralis TaxID=2059726 RepID=UPI003D2D4714